MKTHSSNILFTVVAISFSLATAPALFGQDSPNPPADAAVVDSAEPAEPAPVAPADAERDGVEVAMVPNLIAVLSPTEGNHARGVVTFEALEDDQVRVTARLSGLKPNAKHAIHIHEFGDISAPDGTSAGSHFNPHGTAHGLPDAEEKHPGDFGNLQADAEGNANLVLTVQDLSLVDGEEAIVGRAVIVHADEDKGTQPTGDAGDRIAQGVIAIANPDGFHDAIASNPGEEARSDAAVNRRPQPAKPKPGAELEEAAEKIGRGAEKAARTTVKAVERGADEAGKALKKVGKKIEDAVD